MAGAGGALSKAHPTGLGGARVRRGGGEVPGGLAIPGATAAGMGGRTGMEGGADCCLRTPGVHWLVIL